MKPDFPVWRSLLYVSVETPGSSSCPEGNLIFLPLVKANHYPHFSWLILAGRTKFVEVS